MNDNLAANIQFFRMLHEKFVSVNNYSIQHHVPNYVFRLLFVLSGTMQSDRLEAEFGIYRQLNGGNFYMSSEQIKNSLKLQIIKIFDRLDIYETVVHYDSVVPLI